MHGHEVYCFYTTSFDDICTHRNMKRLVATCEKPTPPLPAMPDINTQKRPPHLPLTESSGTSIESQPHLGTCWSVGEHACRNRFSRSQQPMWLVSLNVFASKFLSGSSSNKKEIWMQVLLFQHKRSSWSPQTCKKNYPSSHTVFPRETERSPVHSALCRQRFRTPP